MAQLVRLQTTEDSDQSHLHISPRWLHTRRSSSQRRWHGRAHTATQPEPTKRQHSHQAEPRGTCLTPGLHQHTSRQAALTHRLQATFHEGRGHVRREAPLANGHRMAEFLLRNQATARSYCYTLLCPRVLLRLRDREHGLPRSFQARSSMELLGLACSETQGNMQNSSFATNYAAHLKRQLPQAARRCWLCSLHMGRHWLLHGRGRQP